MAEDAYERLISLPMFHSMTSQDVDDVVRALRKVLAAAEGECAAALELKKSQ